MKIVLGIVILSFMYELISKLRVGNAVNGFLGSISYEVYILHHGVFALLIALSGGTMNSGVYVISAVLLTILIAYLLKIICQPLIRKINKNGG